MVRGLTAAGTRRGGGSGSRAGSPWTGCGRSGPQRKPAGLIHVAKALCVCVHAPWPRPPAFPGQRQACGGPRPSPTRALSEASLFAVWSGKIPPQLMIHWAPPLRLWAWKETATFSTVQKQGLTGTEQRGQGTHHYPSQQSDHWVCQGHACSWAGWLWSKPLASGMEEVVAMPQLGAWTAASRARPWSDLAKMSFRPQVVLGYAEQMC